MQPCAKPFTKILTKLLPVAVILLTPILFAPIRFTPPLFAADKGDPAFAKWWQKFQLAVMRRDIRGIDKGVEFPLDWQVGPEVRGVRSESDFAANFQLFFTSDVIKNVAAGKPEKLPNGNYAITWKANGKDYTLNIRFYNGVYAMESLIEGRP